MFLFVEFYARRGLLTHILKRDTATKGMHSGNLSANMDAVRLGALAKVENLFMPHLVHLLYYPRRRTYIYRVS